VFTRQKLLNLVTLVRHYKNEFTYLLIQGVREWSPKNFRVSLLEKMWPKTFITFLHKLNRFLKIKLFPGVLGLLKYCFIQEKMFRLKMIAW
jgi:hypothetical protein